MSPPKYLLKAADGASAPPRSQQRPPRQRQRPKQQRTGRQQGQGKGRRQPQERQRQGRSRTAGRQPNPVTRPITPERLGKETRAATNLKFRPLERAVQGDIRASEKRVGEVGDWWQDYLATVAQGREDTAAAYAQAGEEQAAYMEQAGARDTANTNALNAEAAESAKLRGTEVSTDAAEREAAAQAQRHMMAGVQGGALARQGAGQYAYLTDKIRIGKGQSIASRKEEQRRGRTLRQDRRDLARERGDYATTYRTDLRGSEREYLIQRGVAKLDERAQGAEEREGAREAAEAAKERREERRQRAIENRQRQEGIDIDRTQATGKGGMTPSERRDAAEGQRNARATTQRLVRQSGVPKSPKEWAELEEAVAKESEVSAAEARLAVNQFKRRIRRNREKQREKPKQDFPKIIIPGEQIVE